MNCAALCNSLSRDYESLVFKAWFNHAKAQKARILLKNTCHINTLLVQLAFCHDSNFERKVSQWSTCELPLEVFSVLRISCLWVGANPSQIGGNRSPQIASRRFWAKLKRPTMKYWIDNAHERTHVPHTHTHTHTHSHTHTHLMK